MYKPVYSRQLFGGRVEITVYGACRDWNFAGDSVEEMETKNPGIVEAIAWVMGKHRIKRALVPKPAFNAKIAQARDLTVERLPGFWRGMDADGAVLDEPGDAYLLASADCLTTVLYSPAEHYALGLHCGRDALVDRKALLGVMERGFASVIDCAVYSVGHIEQFKAFLAAGIGPSSFTHPTTVTLKEPDGAEVANPYRVVNQRLIDHLQLDWELMLPPEYPRPIVADPVQGTIDLSAFVTAQLCAVGVPLSAIETDDHDTATDRDADGNFLFHSNRRDKTKRNLVIVRLND